MAVGTTGESALGRVTATAGRTSLAHIWKAHRQCYVLLIPSIICMAFFCYYPLWGVSLAFVKFNPFKGVLGSPFVGLAHFERFFSSPNAWAIMRNTVIIASGKLVLGQLTAVVFAIALDQVRQHWYKRLVQTLSTLPHFLSWIIVGTVVTTILAGDGLINRALSAMGLPGLNFLGNPEVFPLTLIVTDVWKGFGWGAVIYLAALTAINHELYEAAAIDGAGRWRRVWHVTLPGILPTIILMACLNLGSILNAGFEQNLVLSNPMVYSTGDIIDTYVYRVGLLGFDYSLGAALGLLRSLVGTVLILTSWWLADRLANYRIF